MVRPALLAACGLLVLAPLAGCSGVAIDPGSPPATPSGVTDPPGSTSDAVASPTPAASRTPSSSPTVTPTPAPSPSPSPTATPTGTPRPTTGPETATLGSADAPDAPDLAGAPARYRDHVTATGRYRLSSSFVVGPGDDRADRLDAVRLRGDGVVLDRVDSADTFRSYDDDLVTARTATASYRPASGPHLYYRNDSFRSGPESGTIQGASYREVIGPPPWTGSDLAVRLAAAVRLREGTQVTVGGDRATRYRVAGLNRSAYDALGLRDRDDVLARVASSEGEAEYPDRAAGTVTLDADGRIRRVNLTLERTRRNESFRPVRRTIAVDARLRPLDGAPAVPTWVERTPSVRFERLPGAGGVAIGVEHVRGPPIRRPSGWLRTGNETSRTEFLLLSRGRLSAGERLYVWVAPRDDENGMEAYTAVGDRPAGPFVPLRVRGLALSNTVRHGGIAWDHRHLWRPNATDGRRAGRAGGNAGA